MKVGKNTKVELYSNNHFKGKKISLTSNIKCLSDKKFENLANSAKIFSLVNHAKRRPSRGCILVFSGCYHSGKSQEICFNIKNLSKYQLNNEISSVKVYSGIMATFYDDFNFKGKGQIWTRDDSCFLRRNFFKKASSVKIKSMERRKKSLKTKNSKRAFIQLKNRRRRRRVPFGCIFVYYYLYYRGPSAMACSNNGYNLVTNGWGYRIQSIRFGRNTKIVLYQNNNWTGKHVKLYNNVRNLSLYNFNNAAGSLTTFYKRKFKYIPKIVPIRKGCIAVFPKKNLKGMRTEFCKDEGEDHSNLKGGLIIKSSKLGKYTQVILFADENLKGRRFKINEKRIYTMKFTAKSLVVLDKKNIRKARKGCIVVYEKRNYRGGSKEFCHKYGNPSNLDKFYWNDEISSIRLGKKILAIIFEHVNFRGRWKLLSYSLKDLSKLNFDKMVSSIKFKANSEKKRKPSIKKNFTPKLPKLPEFKFSSWWW